MYTFNDVASFNFFKFSWFEQSINTLKFKVSASKGFWFCFLLRPNLLKKLHGNLKYLPFYIFIISSLCLTLHCSKWFLLLNWKKLEIFVIECLVSLFHLHLTKYNRNSLWKKIIRPSSSALTIFFSKFYKLTAWYYHILEVFEGNLKNVCQKAIKTNLSFSHSTSNIPMLCYHVNKMNEVEK